MGIVETRDLRRVFKARGSKSTDEVVALDDVTLAVDQGEIHGLLGPNGAGDLVISGVSFGLVPYRHRDNVLWDHVAARTVVAARDAIKQSLLTLRAQGPVIAEGAGSPCEVSAANDLSNRYVGDLLGCDVVLVARLTTQAVAASIAGTVTLCDAEGQFEITHILLTDEPQEHAIGHQVASRVKQVSNATVLGPLPRVEVVERYGAQPHWDWYNTWARVLEEGGGADALLASLGTARRPLLHHGGPQRSELS